MDTVQLPCWCADALYCRNPIWLFSLHRSHRHCASAGKEYRLATYLGAKAVKIEDGEIIVRQGRFTLTIRPHNHSGHPLRAPVGGAMVRRIHEHPACRASYLFEEDGVPLLVLDAPNAAFEYEY